MVILTAEQFERFRRLGMQFICPAPECLCGAGGDNPRMSLDFLRKHYEIVHGQQAPKQVESYHPRVQSLDRVSPALSDEALKVTAN